MKRRIDTRVLWVAGALALTALAATPVYMSVAGGTFTGAITAPMVNNVLNAADYPGADCGAKIGAADAALGGTVGTIQFNQSCGTSAWSNVTLAAGHDLQCSQGGTYNVGTITLSGNQTVDLRTFACELQSKSSSPAEMFEIVGSSQSSNIAEINIYGGLLWAGTNTTSGHAAINIEYATRVRIDGTVIDGGWDRDVAANNFSYLYLETVRANGAATDNIYLQNTGDSPYFGGPAYLEHVQADSCACSDASIRSNDIAGLLVRGSETVGISSGNGLFINSSNGLGASPADYPTGDFVSDFDADTVATYGLQVENTVKSTFSNIWLSTGRTNDTACLSLQGYNRELTFTGVHGFWCGNYGMLIGTSGAQISIKVADSSFSATANGGIHNAGCSLCEFSHNNFNSTGLNGAGVTELYGIYEESTAANNTYIDNDATGTTDGDHYGGTGDEVMEHNGNLSLTGTADFSGAAWLKAPTGSGCTTTANGMSCYDSAAGRWHDWVNGADGLRQLPDLAGTTGSIGGGALTASNCATGTATLTGVSTAMHIAVTPAADPNSSTVQDYDWYGYRSGTNTVTVKVCALVAGTPAATTYNVRVIQ